MWLQWKTGRQESGYQKMLLATLPWPIPFDFYLLHYKEGSSVDWHKDPSKDGFEHHRINLVVWKSKAGGAFLQRKGVVVINEGRLNKFRPDITEHAVEKIIQGQRYVLSFGWLAKEKK